WASAERELPCARQRAHSAGWHGTAQRGIGYRLHTRIRKIGACADAKPRDQNPSEVIGGECEQTLPSANEGGQALPSGGCGRRSLRISRRSPEGGSTRPHGRKQKPAS